LSVYSHYTFARAHPAGSLCESCMRENCTCSLSGGRRPARSSDCAPPPTRLKVKGRWTYLYRAVDKQGRTVDFLLSERRDVAAAKRFFRNAIKNNGIPRVVTLDAYAASHRAIAELKSVGTLPRRVRIRSSKYLNNVVEQDHRRIKQRIRPMLGFKRFDTAAVTITGIELAQKIKKDQFKIGKLSGRPGTAPEIWAAVLAA
jgi:transposase-like protein